MSTVIIEGQDSSEYAEETKVIGVYLSRPAFVGVVDGDIYLRLPEGDSLSYRRVEHYLYFDPK